MNNRQKKERQRSEAERLFLNVVFSAKRSKEGGLRRIHLGKGSFFWFVFLEKQKNEQMVLRSSICMTSTLPKEC